MHKEQRLVDTLIKHWRRRKGALPMPVYEQFVPEALDADVWKSCCAFSLLKSGTKWVLTHEYTGDNVAEAIGKEVTGEVKTLGANGFQEARLLDRAEEMLLSGEPLADEGHFVNDQSKIIKFRSCLLPFGRQERYTHIVLGFSWRAF